VHSVVGEIVGAKAPKRIVVELSTLALADKFAMRDALAAAGHVGLDCPLSGTGAQAQKGDLVVFASGDANAIEKCRPVFADFSRKTADLGEFGNGSKMKFVANLLVAIHNVSTAEAFALGMKAGLDPKTLFEVIGNSAAASRMFQVRGPQMVAGKYDPATISVGLFQKDMKIIGEFAAEHGVATPLFNASAAIYNAAVAQGFAKQDTAAVCAVLEAMAGIKR
jgi:3-hydroxyisobutyrate dehydrogenase-like beta-hydroxyacid dehydrogenase